MRKLAAVLCIDVAGYSKLMGRGGWHAFPRQGGVCGI
ncbi:hypothetical protein J2X71_006355 [Rhizobium sp. 1399]|jgi:hypothetical protein|nr:hypothetical protein [Rhizobium sp. 1399]